MCPMTATMASAAVRRASKIAPNDPDPFREGESVVYSTHGVGRIERIGFEDIAGYRLNFIQVSFDENQMTLRVPLARARRAGLRKLATPEELAELLVVLKGRPRVSRLIWAKRAQEYLAKINSGHVHELAEVVRDLQVSGDGSGGSFSQRNLFELALNRLAAEFAAVNRTEKAGAIGDLTQALLEARSGVIGECVSDQATGPT